MQDRKNLLVISNDFDGCWFHNRGSLSQASENPLIQHNGVIIEELSKIITASKASEVVFMVGSNRQSQPIDQYNAMHNNTTSCYSALEKICRHFASKHENLNKTFQIDKYLLADTYGETTAGENFDASLNNRQNYEFSNWFFDESKLTILYAQMHYLASTQPDAKIAYHFIDDRYYPADENGLLDEDDILFDLHAFFSANPDLIPKNVTLNLHFYNGEDYVDIAKIKGKGEVDADYPTSIQRLIECAGLDYEKDYMEHNQVLRILTTDERLESFKALTNGTADNTDDETSDEQSKPSLK